MTDLPTLLVALTLGLPMLAAGLVWMARTPRQADLIGRAAGLATAAAALATAMLAISHTGRPLLGGGWLLVDPKSGLMLAVTGAVGLCSVLLSAVYLRTVERSWLRAATSHSWYYTVLFVFWAALLAVPVAGNLAIVWVIVDATTAASALLVSFSGRREALEAGWKYLVLTTLGLSLALFGIIVLAIAQSAAGHQGLQALDFTALHQAAVGLPRGPVVAGFVLLLVGLATKIGWAPVHNWLPDAHSEAPAPVSALLSAVLLPAVLFTAWRVKTALTPAIAEHTAATVFIAFGLGSIVVAIPFLWKRMAWKRLLAYSSLEHMGIIAVGIGFGSKLALIGVVVHIAGHALAKSLGFYTALGSRDGSRVVTGARAASLVALAGLPPSPLFVSELLIVLGGIASGHTLLAALTAVAIALGFLGLLHALLEDVVGDERAAELTGAGA